MREIKFRGYAPNYKSWRYGCLDVTKDGKCFIKSINERGAAERTRVDEDSIGQYIDQEDVNGKKIYQGDVLEDVEGRAFRVIWDGPTSMFVIIGDTIVSDFDHCSGEDFEIVGNVYEENLND